MVVSRTNNTISTDHTVKRKEGLISSQIDDEVIILSLENEEYYFLNSVACAIWNMIEISIPITELVKELIKKYDVSEDLCLSETIEYLEELYDIGIIELHNAKNS